MANKTKRKEKPVQIDYVLKIGGGENLASWISITQVHDTIPELQKMIKSEHPLALCWINASSLDIFRKIYLEYTHLCCIRMLNCLSFLIARKRIRVSKNTRRIIVAKLMISKASSVCWLLLIVRKRTCNIV